MKTAYEENGAVLKEQLQQDGRESKAITQPDSRSLIICREEN